MSFALAPSDLQAQPSRDASRLTLSALVANELFQNDAGLERSLVSAAAREFRAAKTPLAAAEISNDFAKLVTTARTVRDSKDLDALLALPEATRRNAAKHLGSAGDLNVGPVEITNSAFYSAAANRALVDQRGVANAVVDLIRSRDRALIQPHVDEFMRSSFGMDANALKPERVRQKLSESTIAAIRTYATVLNGGDKKLAELAAQLLVESNSAAQAAGTAAENYVKTGTKIDPSAAHSTIERLRTSAVLLSYLSSTGNGPLNAATAQAARYALGAVNMYNAALALQLATGPGAVVAVLQLTQAFGDIFGTGGSAPPSEAAVLVQQMERLFEYVKQQFLVVNLKLDFIIERMQDIQAKLNDIAYSQAEILVRVRALEQVARATFVKLDQLEDAVLAGHRQELALCARWSSEKRALADTDYDRCVQGYLNLIQATAQPGYVAAPIPTRSRFELSRIFDRNSIQIGQDIGMGKLVNAFTNELPNPPATRTTVPNPVLLVTAVGGYLDFVERYRDQFLQSPKTNRDEDLTAIASQLNAYDSAWKHWHDSATLPSLAKRYSVSREQSQSIIKAVTNLAGAAIVKDGISNSAAATVSLSFCDRTDAVSPKFFQNWVEPRGLGKIPTVFTTSYGQVGDGSGTTKVDRVKPLRICLRPLQFRHQRGPFDSYFLLNFKATIAFSFGDTELDSLEVSADVVASPSDGYVGTVNYPFTNPMWVIENSKCCGPAERYGRSLRNIIGDRVTEHLNREAIVKKGWTIATESILANDSASLDREVGRLLNEDRAIETQSGTLLPSSIFEKLDFDLAMLRALALTSFQQSLDHRDGLRALLFGTDSVALLDSAAIIGWSQCALTSRPPIDWSGGSAPNNASLAKRCLLGAVDRETITNAVAPQVQLGLRDATLARLVDATDTLNPPLATLPPTYLSRARLDALARASSAVK